MTGTKPREKEIAVFFCTHQRERVGSVLAGLNGSGAMKVRKVALPCSGKLEVYQLTRALEDGADAVALFACPEGECRYVVGSPRGKRRVSHAGKILEQIGLDKDRVRRFSLSAEAAPESLKELAVWVEKIGLMEPIRGCK